MRVLAWITEGGWEAAIDAVKTLRTSHVTLVHVDTVDLPGRGHRHSEVMERMHALAGEAAEALLEDAEERLGREADKRAESGVAETIVYELATEHDVLVLARDGRHSGPHSIGHDQRWVIDHAPCTVIMTWPEGAPDPSEPPPKPKPKPPHSKPKPKPKPKPL
ncbi:hypothetical protein C8N24_3496 [Solirubrobacter pauli]|uniref:Nucleotide-binding universal stress UspA family protein n=1 Tax=Solirubrobacter pauli TaxID=166793 RepID=A0A660LH33_9ACTN|nr:universal stress protein [Solirubrobacter pauli]RKQ93626.1 hypothetical protein C8N24_3496 [Solirubrobacter pauli]